MSLFLNQYDWSLICGRSSIDCEAAIDWNFLSLVSGSHRHLWHECLAVLLVCQRLHEALPLGGGAIRLREKVALARLSQTNYFLSAWVKNLNALCSFFFLAINFGRQRALRLDSWESSRGVPTRLSDPMSNPEIIESIFWIWSFIAAIRCVSECCVVQLDTLACIKATTESLSLWPRLFCSYTVAVKVTALHRLEHQGVRTNPRLSMHLAETSIDRRIFHQRVFDVEWIFLHLDSFISQIILFLCVLQTCWECKSSWFLRAR